MNPTKQSTV